MPLQRVRVTPARQNCTILSVEDDQGAHRAVIVDPGGDVALILDAVRDMHVEAILLTHGHFDHVGGVNLLRKSLSAVGQGDVPLYGPHKADEFLLNGLAEQLAMFVDDPRGFNASAVIPDRFLNDNDRLHLLGRTIEVRHVPGHTPGHIVLVDTVEKCVLTGDTLFRGVIGRTDFPYGDHAQLVTAIREKILTLPDDYIVLPGHGLPSSVAEERRENIFLQR